MAKKTSSQNQEIDAYIFGQIKERLEILKMSWRELAARTGVQEDLLRNCGEVRLAAQHKFTVAEALWNGNSAPLARLYGTAGFVDINQPSLVLFSKISVEDSKESEEIAATFQRARELIKNMAPSDRKRTLRIINAILDISP